MGLRARKTSVHEQIGDLSPIAGTSRSPDLHLPEPGLQFAALPYRLAGGGEVDVLLITSRETRRWVIPKGWPMKGKKPHQAAAIEARQEAGVDGRIHKLALGEYDYVKRLKNGAPLDCTVEVFALEVMQQRRHWREKGERVSRWFRAEDAAHAVEEPALRGLIMAFAVRMAIAWSLETGGPD
jgi:8-oxo-dGTP pyrophosphatase MutT (NUDIX family)